MNLKSQILGIAAALVALAGLVSCSQEATAPAASAPVANATTAAPDSGKSTAATSATTAPASTTSPAPTPAQNAVAADGTVTTPSGLQYLVLTPGTGAEAKPGQNVSVNYLGTLADGTKFDASADHGGPIKFQLGTGAVIKGWDEGVAGMKVGEKRKLTIPANLGYGQRGAGGVIPPGATLIFEVELVDAK